MRWEVVPDIVYPTVRPKICSFTIKATLIDKKKLSIATLDSWLERNLYLSAIDYFDIYIYILYLYIWYWLFLVRSGTKPPFVFSQSCYKLSAVIHHCCSQLANNKKKQSANLRRRKNNEKKQFSNMRSMQVPYISQVCNV